ncbi:hypothetical protein V2W30_23660 [Streptomyces sp. Q6]|uniref:Uncharacterized protein n=1 Tax=Streptomyces citrinus TaxID=3118173 RepID=A0ACD5AFP2_9ACTN
MLPRFTTSYAIESPSTRTCSTVSAARVGPLTRRCTLTPARRAPALATITPGWSPGVAPAGTCTVKGISARVRAGTFTDFSANVIQAPTSRASARTSSAPSDRLSASAPRSATRRGSEVGLVTATLSSRVVPGVPSA